MIRVGILSCSDRGYRGEREDKSRGLLEKMVKERFGGEVVVYKCVPDEIYLIKETILEMIEWEKVQLLLTTGGTGLSPRDVTPEATMQVIDRVIPGFAEEMRRKALEKTKNAIFTRAVVGTRGETLIVNLPGSPEAAELCLNAIVEHIPEALRLLRGEGRKWT